MIPRIRNAGRRHAATLLLVLAGTASCTHGVIPLPPAPPVHRAPAPVPPPAIALPKTWTDWPVSDGSWRYVKDHTGSIATFAVAGGAPLAWLRCDTARHNLTLGRTGTVTGNSAQMTLRTTSGTLQWPTQSSAGAMVATRTAADSGFDWIAFSRGRFTIELPGLQTLVLPNWAEPVHVMEDCRG